MTFLLSFFLSGLLFAQNALEPQIDDFDKVIFYMHADYGVYLKQLYKSWAISADSDMKTQITFIDPQIKTCPFILEARFERQQQKDHLQETMILTNCLGRKRVMVLRRTGDNMEPAKLGDLIFLRLPKATDTRSYEFTFDLLGTKIYYSKFGSLSQGKYEFIFLRYNWWLEYKRITTSESAKTTYESFYKLPTADLQSEPILAATETLRGSSKNYNYAYGADTISYLNFLKFYQMNLMYLRYSGFQDEFASFITYIPPVTKK